LNNSFRRCCEVGKGQVDWGGRAGGRVSSGGSQRRCRERALTFRGWGEEKTHLGAKRTIPGERSG
jgi:hypothetical protein